jgi:uncharacterized protein (DUF1697 family)
MRLTLTKKIKYILSIQSRKTRLDQKYIEKKLNVTATIRNWNTTTQLLKNVKK